MVEMTAQFKNGEQYPLLKVDTGGGDSGTLPQAPPSVVTPGWNVYKPKSSWLSRWPECVSACWMTLILLGISFLVCCALGMGSFRRQPFIIIKCNNTQPGSDVFYHEIVQNSVIPLNMYSNYLSEMAQQYPFLQFNVMFLVNDSMQSALRTPRQLRMYSKLLPYRHFNTKFQTNANTMEVREFQMRHPNVNITLMPLSRFMAKTPLKFKWKNVPTSFLPFYARIYSVWQHGGIGLDLQTFSKYSYRHQRLDRRVRAILKQHNDGKVREYTVALKNVEREEENDIFTMFWHLMHQLSFESKASFNGTPKLAREPTEKDRYIVDKPPVRTHRIKRNILTIKNISTDDDNGTTDMTTSNANSNNIDFTDKAPVRNNFSSPKETLILNNIEDFDIGYMESTNMHLNATNISSMEFDFRNNSTDLKISENIADAQEKNTRGLVFYDLLIFSNPLEDSLISNMLPRFDPMSRNPDSVTSDPRSEESLAIEREGLFVAASSPQHPFLSQLISFGCQGICPKFAVQNTFFSQCSDAYRGAFSCENIHLL